MQDAPLIGPYNPDDVMAWEADGPRTAGRYLSDVRQLVESLPDRPAVLNLLSSRYQFLVGFGAAILRGQLTLLPQSRAPEAIQRVASSYSGCYALTDRNDSVGGVECIQPIGRQGQADPSSLIPTVPINQIVALAFTSGSTGQPTPHQKSWGALVSVARATASRLGITARGRISVVATVPHQHMFGLEASVMLPLQHGLVMHAGRPLFPEDISAAMAEVPGRPLLVTTPLHMRACIAGEVILPPAELVLSATAPLSRALALEFERLFQTRVHEIYGFAEAGSVASRRTTETDVWKPLDGIDLIPEGKSWLVQAEYLPRPVRFPDHIVVNGGDRFNLQGRAADQINLAGHRVSLGDLNQTLLELEGVEDGVFFLPDTDEDSMTRLIAFVVAREKSEEDILRALRQRIDPVFLPRPLILVSALPRNETGKLTREALRQLADQYVIGKPHET